MRTPALAPTRVAPAATIALICSRSRTPPAALTPTRLADDAAHEHDVADRRAARTEAGGRLDEVGAGGLGQRGRRDLLFVGQQRGLDDHLADHAGITARVP